VTSQEPITPHFVDRDIPDTEVFVVSSPAPVFVDSTGRRRRVLRRLAYVFGGLCMVYGGLVSVSLAGGPVSSSAVLPLPDLRGNDDAAADAKPTPIPAPSTSAAPQSRFITESLRRPVSVVRDERPRAPRPQVATPSRTPTPRPTTKSPTPKPTPRPVESTATVPDDQPPESQSPTTEPSAPAPEPPVDEIGRAHV